MDVNKAIWTTSAAIVLLLHLTLLLILLRHPEPRADIPKMEAMEIDLATLPFPTPAPSPPAQPAAKSLPEEVAPTIPEPVIVPAEEPEPVLEPEIEPVTQSQSPTQPTPVVQPQTEDESTIEKIKLLRKGELKPISPPKPEVPKMLKPLPKPQQIAVKPSPKPKPKTLKPDQSAPVPVPTPMHSSAATTAMATPTPPPEADNLNPTPSSPQAINSTASDSEMKNEYLAKLLRHLERYKTYPSAAKLRQIEGKVQLHLRIDQDGSVSLWRITKSSGQPILDDAVARMVAAAQPLPPPSRHTASENEFLIPVVFRLR